MNRTFSIVGYPLTHTMSPPIHKRLFELSGDNCSEYAICEIPPEQFRAKAPELLKCNGFNITIPHKLNIIKLLDGLDISAKRYGAVNVVKCGEKNIGYNTDVDGFLRAIQSLGTDLSGKVLLLGCGGAGRMMAIETARHGGTLTIAVRNTPKSLENAQRVMNNIKMLFDDAKVNVTTLNGFSGHFDLVLNATPVGMYPHCDELPVSKATLADIDYLFDAIYNPSETQLMAAARAQGAKVLGGMSMLVWQAVVAHEIWDDAKYDDQTILSLISEMEAHVSNDFGK